jgi:hypothetical protein
MDIVLIHTSFYIGLYQSSSLFFDFKAASFSRKESPSPPSRDAAGMTTSGTSTTVVIQPCGDLCPLYGLNGCSMMQSGSDGRPLKIFVDILVRENLGGQVEHKWNFLFWGQFLC